MDRNTANTTESLSKTANAEFLREFVTERLVAASREILTAVDKLIAGYEEEASGFRQEIDRQKKQLEVFQQTEVTLRKSDVKCSRSLCHDEEDEVEKEEDVLPKCLENQESLNNQTPSRGRFKKRKHSRPLICKTQDYVHLSICILQDPHTEVLSKNVLKNCHMVKLKCPCGLQEAEFLDLLRATFPQLTGDKKYFDILTSNKTRRLQQLRLKTVTPEEIHRHVSCTGLGKSTLYIRLKTSLFFQAQNKCPPNEEEIHPLPTQDMSIQDSLSTSAVLTCDETRPQTSRIQEVEDSRVEVLSTSLTQYQQDMEGEAEYCIISEVAEDVVSHSTVECKGDGSDKEANDNNNVLEPDKSDKQLRQCVAEFQSNKAKKPKARRSCVKTTETKTKIVDAVLSCKVCGALHNSQVKFVKHVWCHVNDLGSPCGVCGQLSESAEALKDHLRYQHKTDKCHICGESFHSILSLNEHVAAHSGERPYQCDVCHDMFALKLSLENHRKRHGASKLHKCYSCPEVFELKEQLKAHHRTHNNKKMHLCGVCGKSLSDYRSLSRHKFIHTGERPHSCQLCGKRFKLIGTLRQHEKTHMNRERSYLCDVCCKMFLTSKQLQIHMRRHTNEKPYCCGECGRGFTTKGPLTIHMRVHTGETPYRCPDCGISFKRKSNLDDHLTVHTGVKAFVCGICGKACARKTHLTVHMRTHNGERPYKCTLCDKAFTQSHCLKTHTKSHQMQVGDGMNNSQVALQTGEDMKHSLTKGNYRPAVETSAHHLWDMDEATTKKNS
ncbi:zinc finger protein 724-like isoform X2 [Channa argus]|uniref:zinc finger protein 724-like isoform X2 n=1 Tax=Channa argus TaxID=215402 RepID=UPI003520A14C